ncbi:coagulation factor XI-like [Ambystoma mexicanum]|uniref:coagulation factor XI-like n=1 Tax=Ambystoma mexicanum TaxID=8296 RepID=UPI0037E74AEF
MTLVLLAILSGTVDGALLMSMDFPGNDVEMTLAPDAEYCQLICTHHPFCTFFTFFTAYVNQSKSRFFCSLKYNAARNPGSPVPLQGAISGYALAKDDGNLNRCFPKLFPNINFPGNNLKSLPADNATACQDICTTSFDCQFFSYQQLDVTGNSKNSSRCFLKFRTKLPSPPTVNVVGGVMSGFSQRGCCSGAACSQGCADLIIPDMDFQGQNTSQVQAKDVADCQSICTKTPTCHFFTFCTSSAESRPLTCHLRRSDNGIPTGIATLSNVLSGFTKKSSEFQKSEKDCAVFLLPDIEFPGGDIDSIWASDVEHCQRICTQHPRCQFFTFITEQSTDDRKFACNLKRSDAKIPKTVIQLANAVSGFSLTSSGVQKSGKECAALLLPGIDFNGDDLGSVAASDALQCQNLCTVHSQCQFFTFITRGACLYKGSASGIPTSPGPVSYCISGFSLRSSGVQKGVKGCADLILPGVDFPGIDIEMVYAVDAKYCQLLCTYHPRCRFFSFYPKERSLLRKFSCYLKGSTADLPTSITLQSQTVSGFPYAYHAIERQCIPQAYTDVEFPRNGERRVHAASFELCQKACGEDPSCQFFSYGTATSAIVATQGICFPKNVMSRPVPDTIDVVPSVTSGFPLRKCEGDIAGFTPPLPAVILDSSC